MAQFREASTLTAVGGGRFEGSFPPGWGQGPFIFGGLVAGTMLRCVLAEAGAARAPRSMQVVLVAPARVGPVAVEIATLRAGASVVVWRATMVQEGGVCAEAHIVLGGPRASDLDEAKDQAPTLPRPESLWELPVGMAGAPEFTQFYEFRYAAGMPMTGEDNAYSAGWVRSRVPEPIDWPHLAALADAWPPAVLIRAKGHRPMGTITMSLLFGDEPPGQAGGADFLALNTRSDHTWHGYSHQTDGVWDATGKLLVRSTQLVAVVR